MRNIHDFDKYHQINITNGFSKLDAFYAVALKSGYTSVMIHIVVHTHDTMKFRFEDIINFNTPTFQTANEIYSINCVYFLLVFMLIVRLKCCNALQLVLTDHSENVKMR